MYVVRGGVNASDTFALILPKLIEFNRKISR